MRPAPPDAIDLGEVVLRRHRPDDAAALAAAASASLDHLAPWMPWATPEGVTEAAMAAFIETVSAQGEAAGDAVYGMFDPADGSCLGGCGLHDRLPEPGGVEIGYWLRADATGRGFMTRVVASLVEVALGLDGVDRVEVHCDEANVRSAAVPRRLGFTLAAIRPRAPQAPGEVGREMVWVRRASTAG